VASCRSEVAFWCWMSASNAASRASCGDMIVDWAQPERHTMRPRFVRSSPVSCVLVFIALTGCGRDLSKEPDPGGDGGHDGSQGTGGQGTGGQGTDGQGTGGQGTGGQGTGGQGAGGQGTGGRPSTCAAAPGPPCATGWVRNYSVVCGHGGEPGSITCSSPTGDGLCYRKCAPGSPCPDPCFSQCQAHLLFMNSDAAETTYFCGQ
jgi:hypothetical protein